MLKRTLSFLLALCIILGGLIIPSNVHAKKEDVRRVSYDVQNINGKTYKVYKFTDVFGSKKAGKAHKTRNAKINNVKTMGMVDFDELVDVIDGYEIEVAWTTYDLKPGNPPEGASEEEVKKYINTPIYLQVYDIDTDIVIAQTKEINKSGKYKIFKTDGFNNTNASKDPSDWSVLIPESINYDIILNGVGQKGEMQYNTAVIGVNQSGVAIYKAKYFTNMSKPAIAVQKTNVDNKTAEVDINTDNLKEDEYYSFGEPILQGDGKTNYFHGKKIIIKQFGDDGKKKLQVSEAKTAGRVKMAMKAPGKTEFDRGGTFTDNGTPYHYEVTGDYLTPHIFTIRQDLKVNFDPNGAEWKNAPAKDQVIGHSMKLGESWAGLGPITVPSASAIKTDTIPKFKDTENNKEIEQKFIGWTLNKTTGADFKDKTEEEIKNLLVDFTTYEVKDNVTFYAAYAPVAQGKVAIQYVDKSGTAIKDIYKVQGVDYPKFADGTMGKEVDAKSIPQPAFIGYERSGDIVVTGKKYDENGRDTVEVPYKKLDNIIPEKKDGQDNPDVTPGVKEHYAKVTFQVAAADAEKAKLQLDGADATSPLVYYVNPVEGIAIKDVAKVDAVSKDTNLYKVDANNMWTYDPNTITGTDYKIVQAKDTQNKVVKTEITLTAKVADKTAAKFKDKLKPVDIKVWEDKNDTDGSKIDWKKGVELKVKDDTLQGILDKTETKVTDESNRNSSSANLPNGQKGNLKVTFEDGSTIEVKDQTLYVAPHKNDDNTNLPKDAVKVDFKIGEGVTGTAKTEYVKPGTDVKEDAPTVNAKEGYKDAKWYKDDAEATDTDYKVTENAVFTAKATGKDKVVKLDNPENPTNFPKDPTDDSKNDADYVTVKFVADENGKIKEGDAEKTKGIAYAVLKNTEWNDAVTAGLKVPDVNASGNNPKLVGKDKFYTFKEWQKDGKATEFAKVDADVTYTAVFGKADELTVTYKLNAPEGLTVGGTAPTDNTKYLKDEEVTVKALAADNKLAGYKFTGWNTKADGKGTAYAAGAKFAIKADTVLFAQWEKTAKDVIPVDNENDKTGKDGEEIPDNYVFVEFKVKDADADKANIKDDQQAKFKVDPKATVTLPAPALELKGDYKKSHNAKFNEADYTKKVFAQATTIWASVTEKGKIEVRYKYETTPKMDLPDDIAKKPTDLVGDKAVYEDPGYPEIPAEYLIKDKDGKTVARWIPGTWVKTGSVEEGKITYTLTWRYKDDTKKNIEVEYPTSEIYVGDYKTVTPEIYGTSTTETDEAPFVVNRRKLEDMGVTVKAHSDGRLTIEIGENYRGPKRFTIDLDVYVDGQEIATYADVIVLEAKTRRPEAAVKTDDREILEHKAYIFGYPDGSVRPQGNITRAEAAAMIARLLNIEAFGSNTKPMFPDTPSAWYNRAINAVVQRGIMKGYPDGSFKPNDPITRAEFTTMIAAIDNKAYGVAPFADVKGHWAELAIGREYQAGRINGYPDGTFRPQRHITRAEAATILNKIFDRCYDAMSLIGTERKENVRIFTDLYQSFWGYNDMVEATNNHSFKRRVEGRVEEDWVMVK